MFKKSLWIAAVAFSFVISQSALAHGMGCGDGMKHMMSSMKMDDAQKAKIMPVLEQLKTTMKGNEDQMKDIDMQIRQQMFSDKMDQGTVDSLVDKKSRMIGDMMKAKIAAKNQIFNMLTAEQKTTMQDMMKKMEDKMAEKFKSCHDND